MLQWALQSVWSIHPLILGPRFKQGKTTKKKLLGKKEELKRRDPSPTTERHAIAVMISGLLSYLAY